MERYRTTIILVAVLVVLGTLAVVLGGKGPVGTIPGEPTPLPVQYVWQDDNQVVGIDVVSGTNRVSLTEDTTTTIWSLTEPIQSTADPFAVGNVADLLQSLQATTVITGSSDLAQYGLDKPNLSVTATFSDTAHTKRTVQVGAATVDGSGYYTKLPDKPDVYIVSNSTIEPIKSWLETPPKSVPTATPLLPTLAPMSELTGTRTLTGTQAPATAPTLEPPGNISGTNSITTTAPGAAHVTTPEITPLIATATPGP